MPPRPLLLKTKRITKSLRSAKAAQKRGLFLLDRVRYFLESEYYDQTFNGIPLEQRRKAAEDRIKTQTDQAAIYLEVAQLLLNLNDSHTALQLPNRLYVPQYGFGTMMVGDKCLVTYVQKGSDAESKGLKTGEQIVKIGAVAPTRANLWQINYLLYSLRPQQFLDLSVDGVDGKNRQLVVQATAISLRERIKQLEKQKNEERFQPYTCKEGSANLLVCKVRTFGVEHFAFGGLFKAASKTNKLIIDLRGNGGGLLDTLVDFIGHFIDEDVLVCKEQRKGRTRDQIAKAKKSNGFKGELAVIVDSDSASAAEIFARVMQIESRAKIYGDISSGSVMTSTFYDIQIREFPGSHGGSLFMAGLSVTVSDVIMSDGKRLEGVGVIPDFPIGPSGYAMSQGLDPVLSMVVEKMGGKLTPKEAGDFHFLVPIIEGINEK